MWRTKSELYTLIADVKTKKDYEKEIKSRYKQYGELVDQDTIALLLVDELGRNTQSITKIADLRADGDFTVVGRVLSVSDSRTFRRKSGNQGKVVNLEIVDDTGTCRLVLWNEDIEQVKNKDIQPGKTVKVINGYTKQGYTGELEINLGRWGTLQVLPSVSQPRGKSSTETARKITGVLIHKEASRAFFKDDGEFGFVTSIIIRENEKDTQVTLWDQLVKELQSCTIGDTITLTSVTTKKCNGGVEYHMNGKSQILRHR
jgi:replication factor A1